MMKKYKDVSANVLRFCVGLAIIVFMFYMRVLKNRFPSNIIYIENFPLLSISCILVGIHLYILKSLLRPHKPFSIVLRLYDYVQHSYYTVFEFLYYKVPGIEGIFHMLAEFVTTSWMYNIYKYVFIFMDVVIRLCISMVLVVDVCIMERFDLFYKMLILLIIPILLRVFVYIAYAYGFKIKHKIMPEIAFKDLPGGGVDYILSDLNRDCVHCLAKLSKLYDLCIQTILLYVAHARYKKSLLVKCLSACISIHYIIGWGTIAIKILLSF